MFKYISEILGKFTQGQRITALLIVLFSVVIITLGPSLIQDNDCREVYTELDNQRKELLRLNREIINVQTTCTNERLEREREIANVLRVIEEEIKRMERESEMMTETRQLVILDTNSTKSQRSPAYIPIKPDFHNVMDKVHHLQEMINEDLSGN